MTRQQEDQIIDHIEKPAELSAKSSEAMITLVDCVTELTKFVKELSKRIEALEAREQ